MSYDRQKSPFGLRIYLTCFYYYLLINLLVNQHATNTNEILRLISIGLALLFFVITLYTLWFGHKSFLVCLLLIELSQFVVRVISSISSLLFSPLDPNETRENVFLRLFVGDEQLNSFEHFLLFRRCSSVSSHTLLLLVSLLVNLSVIRAIYSLMSAIRVDLHPPPIASIPVAP